MIRPNPSYSKKSLPPGSALRGLRQLLPYLWPSPPAEHWLELRLRVVIALACLVIAQMINITVPLAYKKTVDHFSVEAHMIIVLPVALIVGYGLLRVCALVFSELRDAVFERVAQRAIRRASLRTFRHLHALALRFHLDRQTGGLSRSIERGSKGIESLLSMLLFSIFPTLFGIIGVSAILWHLFNFWFAAVTFITVFSYIAYTMLITEWRITFRRRMNESENTANTKAIDSLLNYETVKYFGNEEHEALRFDEALKSYERSAVTNNASLSLLNIGQGAIISTGLVIIMLMAGNGVITGVMTLGDFVLVNTYLIQLYQPLNFLGFVYREIKQSLVDMENMFQLLAINAEIKDASAAQELVISKGEIVFEEINFSYNDTRSILRGVSFVVRAGQTVAIVGSSGAGKSTISRILFRFYDVGSGQVTIDGQDLRTVTQKSLRAAIGIVPQDTVLFNDSIGYNIAYGRPGATRSEIEDAARLAQIHDFILSTPEGYETQVGERGLKLSGGEKQRVAIARTILKQPSILLFDEATSALDSRTEKEIQKSLREISKGRTTLVVAHRLSTVIDADEIIVLEGGRIVERGNHQNLLAKRGLYGDMWRRQQEDVKKQHSASPLS